MSAIQRIRCPNCGDFAERQVLCDRLPIRCDYVVKTACEACDYLLIMGFPTGRVIEAYAPGKATSRQPARQDRTHGWMNPQPSTGKSIQSLKQVLSRTY